MSGTPLYVPTLWSAEDPSSGRHAFSVAFLDVGTDLSWENCLEVHIDDYCPLDRDDGRVFFSINCPCGDRVGWWLLLYHMMPCHHLRNSAHSNKLNSAGLLYNYFICICVRALWEFTNPRIFFFNWKGTFQIICFIPSFLVQRDCIIWSAACYLSCNWHCGTCFCKF